MGMGFDYMLEPSLSLGTMIRANFGPPLDTYPVQLHGNRVLPLRMRLYDPHGDLLTADDLDGAPRVRVLLDGGAGLPVDVSHLAAGTGHREVRFRPVGNGEWHLNLSTKALAEPGLYTVTVIAGSPDYQVFSYSTCKTQLMR